MDLVIPFLEHLYTAASSPGGVELRTNNRYALRHALYAELRKAPELKDELFLTPSPIEGDKLWIVRKRPGNAATKD